MQQPNVVITSKKFSEALGRWELTCNITLSDGFRSGSHVSELPPDATDQELSSDILRQYGVTA